jgi:hypothetical protein
MNTRGNMTTTIIGGRWHRAALKQPGAPHHTPPSHGLAQRVFTVSTVDNKARDNTGATATALQRQHSTSYEK